MSTTTSSDPEVKTAPKVQPRVLDIFFVDSGWNSPVHNAVQENLPSIAAFLKGHRMYLLDREQSVAFLSRHPSLVGADPILIVLDREAAQRPTEREKGFGFRLCLGHIRNPEAAVSMLKWAIQLAMTSTSNQMADMVRKCGHRQTVQGTIELIGEGSAHLLEFAPV